MIIPLYAAIGQTIIMLLLGAVAIFLILLVLVQRGRGGGLAGALGGMGGSSAFGAKAGDVFTKITCVAAFFWIALCIFAAKMGPSEDSLIKTNTTVTSSSTTTDAPAISGVGEDEPSGDQTDSQPAAGADSAEETSEQAPAGSDAGAANGDEAPQE